jgi:hypothetical protein
MPGRRWQAAVGIRALRCPVALSAVHRSEEVRKTRIASWFDREVYLSLHQPLPEGGVIAHISCDDA